MSGQFGRSYSMAKADADSLIVTPENSGFIDYVYLTDGYLNNGPGLYGKLSDGTYRFIGSSVSNSLQNLFDHYASVGNVGAGEDTLYSDNLPANTFYNNGDKVEFKYQLSMADTNVDKTINVYLGANKIFDGAAIAANLKAAANAAGGIIVEGWIIKSGATTARSIVTLTATSSDGTTIQEILVTQNDIAGPIVFTDILALAIKAQATNDNDVVAHAGSVIKKTAAR